VKCRMGARRKRAEATVLDLPVENGARHAGRGPGEFIAGSKLRHTAIGVRKLGCPSSPTSRWFPSSGSGTRFKKL